MWQNPSLFFQKRPCEATGGRRRTENSAAAANLPGPDAVRRSAADGSAAELHVPQPASPRLAAGRGSALLVEFIGAATNLILQVDWNHSAGLSLHNLQLLPGFGRDFDCRRDSVTSGLISARAGSAATAGTSGTSGKLAGLPALVCSGFALVRLALPPEVDFLAIFGYSF